MDLTRFILHRVIVVLAAMCLLTSALLAIAPALSGSVPAIVVLAGVFGALAWLAGREIAAGRAEDDR